MPIDRWGNEIPRRKLVALGAGGQIDPEGTQWLHPEWTSHRAGRRQARGDLKFSMFHRMLRDAGTSFNRLNSVMPPQEWGYTPMLLDAYADNPDWDTADIEWFLATHPDASTLGREEAMRQYSAPPAGDSGFLSESDRRRFGRPLGD